MDHTVRRVPKLREAIGMRVVDSVQLLMFVLLVALPLLALDIGMRRARRRRQAASTASRGRR